MSVFVLRTSSALIRCASFPDSASFRLLRSQVGSPYLVGSVIISSIFSTSVSGRKPTLRSGFTPAFLRMAFARLRLTPLISVNA